MKKRRTKEPSDKWLMDRKAFIERTKGCSRVLVLRPEALVPAAMAGQRDAVCLLRGVERLIKHMETVDPPMLCAGCGRVFRPPRCVPRAVAVLLPFDWSTANPDASAMIPLCDDCNERDDDDILNFVARSWGAVPVQEGHA